MTLTPLEEINNVIKQMEVANETINGTDAEYFSTSQLKKLIKTAKNITAAAENTLDIKADTKEEKESIAPTITVDYVWATIQMEEGKVVMSNNGTLYAMNKDNAIVKAYSDPEHDRILVNPDPAEISKEELTGEWSLYKKPLISIKG